MASQANPVREISNPTVNISPGKMRVLYFYRKRRLSLTPIKYKEQFQEIANLFPNVDFAMIETAHYLDIHPIVFNPKSDNFFLVCNMNGVVVEYLPTLAEGFSKFSLILAIQRGIDEHVIDKK